MANKSGILVDVGNFKIVREITYDDIKVDGMFHKVDGELLPAAYIFPIENKDKVIEQLERLKTKRKEWDDLTAEIYYKVFPKLR